MKETPTTTETKPPTFKAQIGALISGALPEIPCEWHPGEKRRLSPDDTEADCRSHHYDPSGWTPIYSACPVCAEIQLQERLESYGVPDVNLRCAFANWTPADAAEHQHLADCREFAGTVRKGFLFLLGPVGTGKTHLAVAIMRRFKTKGVFVKQSTLLRNLRATYSDKAAKDPIERCQSASVLVLDEMGVSGGGKDEWPMLSEILDYRYGDKLPTIITSNLAWDELRAVFGERLSDRLREAAFRVLAFSGSSHRADQRENYFKEKAKQGDKW